MNRLPAVCRFLASVVAVSATALFSSGASAADVSGLLPTPGTNSFNGTLVWQGLTRQFFVIRPNATVTGAPALILLHPLGTTTVAMANLARAGRLAAQDGAWVFVPAAVNGQWHDDPSPTGPEAGTADDVGFLSALIDLAVAQYHIDSKRIYAAGYSNGGYMSQRLGCELTDKVAAIGSVAAGLRVTEEAVCRPSLALPVVMMLGTSDPVVAYAGNAVFVSAVGTSQFWAGKDRCIGSPVASTLPRVSGDPTSVALARYGTCTSGSEVRLYTVQSGGHTWPGSPYPVPSLGDTSQVVDATLELWKVFSTYHLP